jgi:hypothetical protein
MAGPGYVSAPAAAYAAASRHSPSGLPRAIPHSHVEGVWRTTAPEALASGTRRTMARAAVTCGIAVAALTALRLVFLWRSDLELDFEEAQYWLWAQTPAWGYWSKPPMVAWLIAATTAVCGDGEPCVRLAAPLIHGLTAVVVGTLGHLLGGPVLGLWSTVAYATMPGVALSVLLLTTDVPLVCCWAVALVAFVRLRDGGGWAWAAVGGGALGAGMLSKYSMVLFVPCAALYLARSGRRIAPARVALAGGLAVLLVAPNVAWNLSNHLATVQHSASRLLPGGSGFRLAEPLLFLLGQLALIGPSLGVALVLALVLASRDPTGRWDDLRLLLGAFTVPPVAVALLVGIVSRANLNWAAPAYVAGCVLAVAWALEAGRQRPLARAIALNVVLGLAMYGALVAVPALRWRGRRWPVAEHFHGWGELGRRAAARAAELGDARVLADLRELLSVAGYYGRVPQSHLVEWDPSGLAHSQFQAQTRLEPDDPGPWLYVSYRPRPAGVTRRFAEVDLIDVVTVELGAGLTRTHWLFALRDFRGYPIRRRATGAASPPSVPPPGLANR